MITNAAAALALLAMLFGFTPDYDGPMRWESTHLTISSTAKGVDLDQVTRAWGDTITFTEVTGPADITFVPDTCQSEGAMCGGEARRTFSHGYISSCTIAVQYPDLELMTHELGHCLGLSHDNMGKGSNMHWFAGDYEKGWSDSVTDRDIDTLVKRYAN